MMQLAPQQQQQQQHQPWWGFIKGLALLLVVTSGANGDAADWVDYILDETKPIPACSLVEISEIIHCMELCELLGDTLEDGLYRKVGDELICYCQNIEACTDDPSCQQLLIFPGSVEESCQAVCGDGVEIIFEDSILLPGDISSGNKNQTTNQLSCFCNEELKCDEGVLFSDLSFLERCADTYGVDSEESCLDHCQTKGNFETASYDATAGECTCSIAEGSSLACSDTNANPKSEEETGPCCLAPSDAPVDGNDGKDSNKDGANVPGWMSVLVLSFSALLFLWI